MNVCDPENYSLCINDSFNLEVISINHQPNLSLIQNYSGRQNTLLEFFVNATDLDDWEGRSEDESQARRPAGLDNPL